MGSGAVGAQGEQKFCYPVLIPETGRINCIYGYSFEEILMDRHSNQTQRRQVINELRHQLRYAQPSERHQIRQELDFWQRQPK